MTEIANKIQSIRNMKNDLNSIKLLSQKNADKMLEHLADFRNQICNQMSKIENNYQSGRNNQQNEKRKSNDLDELNMLNSDSEHNGSEDLKRMSEMLLKWENYDLMGTDVSASSFSTHKSSHASRNNGQCYSSMDTLDSLSTPDKVNILFSKQLPCTTPDPLPSGEEAKKVFLSTPTNPPKSQPENKTFQNGNNPMSKDKVDKLTKKLKEIQTQNEELRNVNRNIRNLLLKLGDLKYTDNIDARTVDKHDNQMPSDLSYRNSEVGPEAISKMESYQQLTRSVEIKNTTRNNILTRINVAKLIIRRIRSSSEIADREHKYTVRVRQAEQSITVKAHHNKPV